MKRLMLLSSALIFSATMVMAAAKPAITANDVVTAYQALGYTSIEVITGPTQIKVDAIQGQFKVEVIYDAKTGAILAQHSMHTGMNGGTPGVVLTTVSKDFLGKGVGSQGGQDDGKVALSGEDDKGDRSEARDDNGGRQGGDHEDSRGSDGGSGHKSSGGND